MKRNELMPLLVSFFEETPTFSTKVNIEFLQIPHMIDLRLYANPITPFQDVSKELILASECIAHLVDNMDDAYTGIESRYEYILDYINFKTNNGDFSLKARSINLYEYQIQKIKKVIEDDKL